MQSELIDALAKTRGLWICLSASRLHLRATQLSLTEAGDLYCIAGSEEMLLIPLSERLKELYKSERERIVEKRCRSELNNVMSLLKSEKEGECPV